jgi:outer membrane protein OmpA-like peptidoglycan-associated protein
MVRLFVSVAAITALLCIGPSGTSPGSAEACGLKLPVKSAKIMKNRTARGAAGDRTVVRAGPQNPDQREPTKAGGTGRSDAIGGGGGDTGPVARANTQPTPRRSEPVKRDRRATPKAEPRAATDVTRREETPASPDPDLGRAGETEADTDVEEPTRGADKAAKFTGRLFFGNASTELSSSSRARLKRNARWLEQNPDKSITIEGHANTTGDPEANHRLSEMRAEAVKEFLVEQGVDSSRISVSAFGSERPEFSPGSSGKNRRVTIVVH